MTPTTKLTLIAAKCRSLLALAEKRTPGKWRQESIHTDDRSCALISAGINDYGDGPAQYVTGIIPRGVLPANNAAYIAACSGSAEAGWHSTLAAIEAYQALQSIGWGWDGDGGAVTANEAMIDAILAAWPDELLI